MSALFGMSDIAALAGFVLTAIWLAVLLLACVVVVQSVREHRQRVGRRG